MDLWTKKLPVNNKYVTYATNFPSELSCSCIQNECGSISRTTSSDCLLLFTFYYISHV